MGLREKSLLSDINLSFVNLWTLAVDWMSVETFVAKTSLQNNMYVIICMVFIFFEHLTIISMLFKLGLWRRWNQFLQRKLPWARPSVPKISYQKGQRKYDEGFLRYEIVPFESFELQRNKIFHWKNIFSSKKFTKSNNIKLTRQSQP